MTDISKRLISVSTEPVPVEEMIEYFKELEFAGADMLHCDIMDGIVVEKATYNEQLLGDIKANTDLALDVHLMINEPYKLYKKYLKLRPQMITVQYEHFLYERQLRKVLKKIRRKRVKAGLSLSPNIPVSYILPFIPYVDMVLVMGVNIGSSGQTMHKGTIEKVKQVSMIRDKFRKDMLVGVDGGVNYDNVNALYEAGANLIVSGSLLYKSFSKKYAVDNLREPGKVIVK